MTSAPPIMFFALLIVLAIILNGFRRRTLVVVNQIALDVGVVLYFFNGRPSSYERPICARPSLWWRTIRILLRPDDKVDH